jgi:signal transduction histidine kinase
MMDTLTVMQHTLDGLPFGVTLWRAESDDPDDLTLMYANARASREAGLDLKALVGKRVRELLPPSVDVPFGTRLKHEGLSAALERTARTIPRFEYVDKRGKAREFRIHMVPVWERTVALVYEQLDAQADAEAHGRVRIYFEDIVRTLHEPLLVLDHELRIQWANDVFLSYADVELAAVEGVALVDFLATDDSRQSLALALGSVLPGDEPLERRELTLSWGDKEPRTCLVSARRLNSRDSDQQLLLVALEDVTERHHREALQHHLVEALVRARDEERRAIARDLHDHVGQALTAHTLHLEQLERSRDLGEAKRRAAELHQRVEELLSEVSRIASQLHPHRLEQLGLVAALGQHLAEFQGTHAVGVDFMATGFDGPTERLPPQVEIGVYRMVQEALTNVARHAEASSVNVIVHRSSGRLRVVVEDDGRGFEPVRPSDSTRMGLATLRERAQLLGGQLTVESSPGKGTTIAVTIPLSDGPAQS